MRISVRALPEHQRQSLFVSGLVGMTLVIEPAPRGGFSLDLPRYKFTHERTPPTDPGPIPTHTVSLAGAHMISDPRDGGPQPVAVLRVGPDVDVRTRDIGRVVVQGGVKADVNVQLATGETLDLGAVLPADAGNITLNAALVPGRTAAADTATVVTAPGQAVELSGLVRPLRGGHVREPERVTITAGPLGWTATSGVAWVPDPTAHDLKRSGFSTEVPLNTLPQVVAPSAPLALLEQSNMAPLG